MLLVTYDTEETNLQFDPLDVRYYQDPSEFSSSNRSYENEFDEVTPSPLVAKCYGRFRCEADCDELRGVGWGRSTLISWACPRWMRSSSFCIATASSTTSRATGGKPSTFCDHARCAHPLR
jgi:hypothetical protein